MRISIPRIDYVPSLPPSLQVSTDVAAERLALFLEQGRKSGRGTVILCGAGVSVDRCACCSQKTRKAHESDPLRPDRAIASMCISAGSEHTEAKAARTMSTDPIDLSSSMNSLPISTFGNGTGRDHI